MDTGDVQTSLIEILEEIQAISGYDCPPISIDTKPLEALPGFDSLIYPTAAVMLEAKLNIIIPDEVNIFYQNKALNIAEIVELVIGLASYQIEGELEGVK